LFSVIFIHFKVEESPEIQPSAVALPSPLIATLIQTEEEPTEKPVRGHKPWFGPPFLPADPVKQPKPIIVICFKIEKFQFNFIQTLLTGGRVSSRRQCSGETAQAHNRNNSF